jgi:hypothetical protein
VFISYTWEEVGHGTWVQSFAARLRRDGVNVRLDRWDAPPGTHIAWFMERETQDADYVVLICTDRYRHAANSRTGGVGYESQVITGELWAMKNDSKFIPILRRGEWRSAAPTYLLGKHYVDLRGDPYSEESYAMLLRTLLRRWYPGPPIGHPPHPPPSVRRGGFDDRRIASRHARAGTAKVVAHFLDHYVLDCCGYRRGMARLDHRIEAEAELALRLTLLAVDEVLVPAVSYFQSPLCRRVLNRYRELFDAGMIKLVGDADRWDEFQDNRMREYAVGSAQHDLYSRIGRARFTLPGLLGSPRNTTTALHREWLTFVDGGEYAPLLPDSAAGRSAWQPDLERRLVGVPDVLGPAAFIADNVYPLLYLGTDPTTLSRLCAFICELFFVTFMDDFAAGFVTDLTYVSGVRLWGGTFSISYGRLLRELRSDREVWPDLRRARPLDMIRLRRDERIALRVADAVSVHRLPVRGRMSVSTTGSSLLT